MKYIITVVFILLINTVHCQNLKLQDTVSVSSSNGLALRLQPDLKSEKIGLLKYGEKVHVISYPDNQEEIEILGLKGKWVSVSRDNKIGYVFDAFLSALPTINIEFYKGDSQEFCFDHALSAYSLQNLKPIDSTFYTYHYEEGYHGMNIYEYEEGHQFIQHSYYESGDTELQLNNIRTNDGIQLVKNLLTVCGFEEIAITYLDYVNQIRFKPRTGPQNYTIIARDYGSKFLIRTAYGF